MNNRILKETINNDLYCGECAKYVVTLKHSNHATNIVIFNTDKFLPDYYTSSRLRNIDLNNSIRLLKDILTHVHIGKLHHIMRQGKLILSLNNPLDILLEEGDVL